MDIGHVRNKNSVERGGDRPARTDGKRSDEAARSEGRDEAKISDSGREAASTVDGLAERARSPGDRQEVVRAAMQRLMNGELDGTAVHHETARKMIDSGYLAG